MKRRWGVRVERWAVRVESEEEVGCESGEGGM